MPSRLARDQPRDALATIGHILEVLDNDSVEAALNASMAGIILDWLNANTSRPKTTARRMVRVDHGARQFQ
jgi:hypothetical protein